MTGLQDALRLKGLPESMAWNLGHFIDMLNDGAALDDLLNGPDGAEMHDLYRTLRLLLGEGDPGAYDADYKPGEEEEEGGEEADSPVTQEDPSPRADDLVVDAEDVPAADDEEEDDEEDEDDDDDDSDMAEEIDDADVKEDRPWA